jgi:hypothetical protein
VDFGVLAGSAGIRHWGGAMTLGRCGVDRIDRRPKYQAFQLDIQVWRHLIPVYVFKGNDEVGWEDR